MSTFFEKLTGAKQKAAAVEMPEIQEEPKEIPQKQHAKTHHVAVTAHDAPATQLPPEEADEEGELTVDIYDKGPAIVIQSTVAGVKPENLDISITNDSVTIRGKRERPEDVHDQHYYYKELFWGTFSRSIMLPEEIDEDAVEANLKHGLLTLHLPKKRRGVIQKIKVKVT